MFLKNAVFGLIVFVGVTSAFGGAVLCFDPEGNLLQLPLSVLQHTPFKNFLIPGLVLALPVAGVNFMALVYLLAGKACRYRWAIAAGMMIIGWIIVQVVMIRVFFWPQMLYLFCGFFIIISSVYLDRQRKYRARDFIRI